MKLGIYLCVGWLVWSMGGHWGRTATNDELNFQEVYQVLKENLAGITAEELDAAAARGLIENLAPRVSLAKEKPAGEKETNAAPLAKPIIYERAYGYLRVAAINPALGKQLAEIARGFASTNRLKGLILDLRYADGDDYAAAAAAADQFLSTEQPMIDYGDGVKKATAKTNALVLPVAILVNGKTAEAGEALAGILRKTEVGLLLGSTTAGQASIAKEVPLKSGQRLRIATDSIKVGAGEALAREGLTPDIQVAVDPEEELLLYKDPFAGAPKTNVVASVDVDGNAVTNRPARRRINEAELVRMMREGINPDAELATATPREIVPAKPVMRDPALARAIDLLKGLAVVQQFRAI